MQFLSNFEVKMSDENQIEGNRLQPDCGRNNNPADDRSSNHSGNFHGFEGQQDTMLMQLITQMSSVLQNQQQQLNQLLQNRPTTSQK
jgi:hypothetical protein